MPAPSVEYDPAPASPGNSRGSENTSVPPSAAEVLVVAEVRQCPPAGRVHVSVGEAGRGQRHRKGLREQGADGNRAAAGGASAPELRLRPESRAGGVYRGEFRVEQAASVLQGGGVLDEERGERAEGLRGVRTVAGRRHQPPPCDALLVVGAGVAVVGAGAGGVVGGASCGVVATVVGAGCWAAGADS